MTKPNALVRPVQLFRLLILNNHVKPAL